MNHDVIEKAVFNNEQTVFIHRKNPELQVCVAGYPDHPLVKKSKDVAAGAVLISAIGSVIIGILVFAPFLFK